MSRIKTSTTRHHRHKRILEQAKGFRMTRRKLIRQAKDAVLHAGQYAFSGRKNKKRNFRTLWIQRINAGLTSIENAPSYSRFIKQLSDNKILLDRKILAYLATNNPLAFKKIVHSLEK